MQDIHHFINGSGAPSANGATFAKHSPLDNQLLAQVAEGGQADVNAAVDAARAALRGPWGRMGTEQRVAMLHAVADEIAKRTSASI